MRRLEVITRHLVGRPSMLATNMNSVRAMTGEWVQTLLPDEEGRGVLWANVQLRTYEPQGDYVWVLDDDDMVVCKCLPTCVNMLADLYEPDMIMVRFDHGAPLGILPDETDWTRRNPPRVGGIGGSSAIFSARHWRQCRHAWGERYEGDFDMLSRAFAEAKTIIWHGCIVGKCQRPQSQGAME